MPKCSLRSPDAHFGGILRKINCLKISQIDTQTYKSENFFCVPIA